ncbi:multidrug resistance protein D [Vibrio cholerae]|nr:multidrug resistance protein D [Vibrio cholerae]
MPATARKKEPVLRSYHYVLSDRRFQGYLICQFAVCVTHPRLFGGRLAL